MHCFVNVARGDLLAKEFAIGDESCLDIGLSASLVFEGQNDATADLQ